MFQSMPSKATNIGNYLKKKTTFETHLKYSGAIK